ncbi:hypothetical protein ABZ508_26225 [Streptomyces lavendulocolor]|uniref:Uncharacterized protein n=1 Tax=Streptomyces lavendulocolor TaxID=67316 RepID=A0ABV2WC11_9ACTN
MRTFWKKAAGPVGQPGQPRQPMAPRPPKPLTISNAKEFREALAGLRTYKGLSLERLNENATAAGEPLPPSTVTSTLRRDQLPSLKFVTQYLQACGLSDDEQTPWGEAWHAVNDGVAPVKRSRNWTQALAVLRLVQPRRLHLSIALVTAAVVAAGAGVVWWQHAQDEEAAARAAQQQQREDDQKAAAERKRRCGTANQALLSTAAGECVGITDGRDGHSLFGKGLQPALAAIDAENRAATKSPGYVTVALLGPLTDGPNSLSGGRAVHQVEGAFIAQHRANQGNAYPKIRLVLANTGSEQKDWRTVTDWLKPMTSTKDRLVAVTGMGLSRQETIDAARALSKAGLHPDDRRSDHRRRPGHHWHDRQRPQDHRARTRGPHGQHPARRDQPASPGPPRPQDRRTRQRPLHPQQHP